ncbi:MAG: hypothetical protein IKF17_06055 [Clostridia bacterium]|nr:hypothetical protein [Clostridia bacterium]
MKKQKLHQIGTTADGVPVFEKKINHASTHNHSRNITSEAISKITLNEDEEWQTHVVEFDRNIGYSNCVKVSEQDEIVYAVRKYRDHPSRMVKGYTPQPCNSLIVILKKSPNTKGVILVTAFVGEKDSALNTPWGGHLKKGTDEYKASVNFWKNHALIFEGEDIKRVLNDEEAQELNKTYFENTEELER